MKHHILTAILALSISLGTAAQSLDKMYIDARGSFLQDAGRNHYTSTLAPEYLNIHLYGTIADNVTFRIRQRLNVAIDSENPFRATDWLCINWQANEKLKLYAGKTGILIGGYEYDSAPIDVYYYSYFCSNLSQAFAFSTGGEYEFTAGQKVAFQIANSPLCTSFDEHYSYNFAWIGNFRQWWNTLWSLNLVEDQNGRNISYIALGNHCVFGGLAIDVDIINRAAFSQSRFFFSDFSAISKVIWSVGKWNLCGKAGYEKNDSCNVGGDGKPYDSVVIPGTEYIYGGCGVEYFPLGDDNVRLHIAAYNDNVSGITYVTSGVKWRFDIK